MTWVTLLIVSIAGLGGIFQIPLVQDLVTASGFSTAEMFSGIAMIVFFFYLLIGVFTVKT